MFERLRSRLRRRGFLGGIGGVTAAFAGCEAFESDADGSPKETTVDGVPSKDLQAGGLHPPPAYELGVRGARHPAWLARVCSEDHTTTATSFESVGTGLAYGLVSVPAGMVPLLRVVVALHNDTEGEHTAFRLTTPGRRERNLDPLIAVRTDGSTGVNRLYDEVYLNETPFGTSFKGSLGDGTMEARLRVTGGRGSLRSTSTAALVYEVAGLEAGGVPNSEESERGT